MKTPSLLDSRKIVNLPVGAIKPNPRQPRKQFSPEDLRELSDSIRLYGILQPLAVRKTGPSTFELVAGERRLRAAALAGLESVPCILLNVDEEQSGLLALVENLQRKDLDFIEEAEGLRSLIRTYGMSQEEAARCISKSQSAVANKLRVLKLPEDVLRTLRDRGFTERHARALLRLEDPEKQRSALDFILRNELTVAKTEEYIDALLRMEAQPPARKKKRKPPVVVLKDVRIFLNTVTRGLSMMNRGGVKAVCEQKDTPGELVLTIRIPHSGGEGVRSAPEELQAPA
ncbi:MAG: ParB/RepB/Spo0J family partition protein [Oscillospiraceae bacterium]|nr:ParB/RepB/Spo0J family partition protein [Oscillospiraceae bacterium]